MGTVELTIDARPAHVGIARLVAAAVARRSSAEADLIDEIKLAVGEACSRAVSVHQQHAPDAPVVVQLTTGPGEFAVAVLDQGPPGSESDPPPDSAHELTALAAAASDAGASIALALIAALADEVSVRRHDGGTVVRMRWSISDGGGAP
jgi:serine/threonine-protein kinase RsbW